MRTRCNCPYGNWTLGGARWLSVGSNRKPSNCNSGLQRGYLLVFLEAGVFEQIAVSSNVIRGSSYANLGARCWWRSSLRHAATNRKAAGSIPDGVIGILH